MGKHHEYSEQAHVLMLEATSASLALFLRVWRDEAWRAGARGKARR
jgi:hypothetical protein